MWFGLLVTTGILIVCRVSGRPIYTELTNGMTGDSYKSNQDEDTYLRFQSRTRSAPQKTEYRVNSKLFSDTAKPEETTMERASVSSSKLNERHNGVMKDGNENEEQEKVVPIKDNEGNEDGELPSIGEIYGGKRANTETLQRLDAAKPYGEQGDEISVLHSSVIGDTNGESEKEGAYQNIGNAEIKGEINDVNSVTHGDDVDEVYIDQAIVVGDLKDNIISHALETPIRNGEQNQGPIHDDSDAAPPKITESEIGETKDSYTLSEGETSQAHRQITLDIETSKQDIGNNYLDSTIASAEEASDVDGVVKELTKMLDSGFTGGIYVISDKPGQVIVNQDDALGKDRYRVAGKDFLYSEPNSIAPKEMTQNKENTEEVKNGSESPLQAIIDFAKSEGNDGIDVDISGPLVSEVESLALPLLQIAQGTRPFDNSDSNNREVSDKKHIYVDITGSIGENNEKHIKVEAPLRAVNEIAIIYSF